MSDDVRARAGMTLIELSLVILMISLVLGLGLGVITRMDFSDRVAVSLVRSTLRSARNWAVAQGAPARVVIEPETKRIRAEGLAVVGTWHFETPGVEGAFGLDGALNGGTLVDDGWRGRALSFAGTPPGTRVEFPVQHDAAWNPAAGFAVRCAVRRAPDAGGELLALGESLGVECGADGSIAAWLCPVLVDETGAESRGGRIPLRAPSGTLVPGRWTAIEASYDRRELRLFADGVLVAARREDAPVWQSDGPLVVSPGRQPFPGDVDELVVSMVAVASEAELPRTAAFAAGTPRLIVFAPGGGLDRDVHAEPVDLAVELDDGRAVPIRVQLYGTVE